MPSCSALLAAARSAGRTISPSRRSCVGIGCARSSSSRPSAHGVRCLGSGCRGRLHRPPAWRGRRAIQAPPHSSWPSSRSAALTDSTICGVRASMIALVRPDRHRHRQERRVDRVPARHAERHVGRAERHVDAELVADPPHRLVGDVDDVGVGADRHRERVDDDVLDGQAVRVDGGVEDLLGQHEALVGLHRDLVVVVGQRDDGGAVLLDQRQDRRHPVVLGGDRVDQSPALVDRQAGLERLDDRRVDADRQVGQLLDQRDRLLEQLGLVGQRHAHVDVEHHRAAGDLRRDVALDRRQVAGAQLLLEDPAAGRVDPLADDAERLVVADRDLLRGRAQVGVHRDRLWSRCCGEYGWCDVCGGARSDARRARAASGSGPWPS